MKIANRIGINAWAWPAVGIGKRQKRESLMITKKQIYDLAQECLDLYDRDKDGWGAYEIEVLLKDLTPEEATAVASMSVTISAGRH
jgi:hypothetical protein